MAADGLPIEVACRVLDVSVSGYYGWLDRCHCRPGPFAMHG